MKIDDLSEMAATLAAISLASERLVTIAKTIFPVWLADEKKTDAQEVDLIADKARRLTVLGIAFVSAWFTAAMLTEETGLMKFVGDIKIGNDLYINAVIVGLLGSGGSSLWNNVLGYTKAVKEVQTLRKTNESLTFSRKAKEQGLTTFDSGNAVRVSINEKSLDQLTTLSQPDFDINNSRLKRV